MTRSSDPLFDQRIADWLEDDPSYAPGHVLDTVLAALPSIPRRRASRVPLGFTTMPMFTRLAAAAAVGVLAVGGALYLTRPGQPATGDASPSSSASAPVVTPAPTASHTAGPTSAMATGRGLHTATLLADGRVLIAGGHANGGRVLASAEVYDPTTDVFISTGSMTTPRAQHTATALADGRVLLIGGSDGGPSVASAEIFDPATGTFIATGSMANPRAFQTATVLSDGRVLVTGGLGASGLVAAAEIYDPKSGTFSPTAPMAFGAYFETATLLTDARVLVAGGAANSATGLCFASAEIFDPTSGTFSPTGSMGKTRCGHTATLLRDGRVLMTTGTASLEGAGRFQSSAEIFDPTMGTFSPTGSMAHAPGKQTAVLLSDGRVLIAGGNAVAPRSLASAELYDPSTGTYSPTGSMAAARTLHTATLLSDGRVLVTGGTGAGWNFAGPFRASAEIYDPATGAFSPAGSGD